MEWKDDFLSNLERVCEVCVCGLLSAESRRKREGEKKRPSGDVCMEEWECMDV